MSEFKEPKVMVELRALKAEIDAEYAHLPFREAVQKRLADSAKTAERLGFRYAPAKPTPTEVVAETPAPYQAGRRPAKSKKI